MSELVEPVNVKAKALQLDPVIGVHAVLPSGKAVNVNEAFGGLLVIVSVAPSPDATFVIVLPEASVNTTPPAT